MRKRAPKKIHKIWGIERNNAQKRISDGEETPQIPGCSHRGGCRCPLPSPPPTLPSPQSGRATGRYRHSTESFVLQTGGWANDPMAKAGPLDHLPVGIVCASQLVKRDHHSAIDGRNQTLTLIRDKSKTRRKKKQIWFDFPRLTYW